MNGLVDYNDDILIHWLPNFGLSSQVPGIVSKSNSIPINEIIKSKKTNKGRNQNAKEK